MDKTNVNDIRVPEAGWLYGGMVGGVELHYRQWIPYHEKDELAIELARQTIAVDEESGIVYLSHQYNLVETYLVTKYYTNIDVSEIDDYDGYARIHDMFASDMVWHNLLEGDYRLKEDIKLVESICDDIFKATKEIYEAKNHLFGKIKTLLGGILGDESLTESLAKAEGVNAQMIEMFGALNEKRERDESRVKGPVPIKSGMSSLLNFSKKKN